MKNIIKYIKLTRIFKRKPKPWQKTKEELESIISSEEENKMNSSNALIKESDFENKIKLFDQETQELIRKYRIYEDSVADTVNRVKKDVPEIDGHIEFRKWVDSVIDQEKQLEVLNKAGIVILKQKSDVLLRNKIDAHHLFKYQDRDYEVSSKII